MKAETPDTWEIDTENAVVSHTEIKGNDVIISELPRDGAIILAWSEGGYLYTVDGEYMEKDELIKIAENLDLPGADADVILSLGYVPEGFELTDFVSNDYCA